MPHITVEYTSNIHSDWKILFGKLHPVMKEMTGTPSITNCKSRAYCCSNDNGSCYLVGDDGGANDCFIHVEVALLEGKSKEEKQAIGMKVKDMFVEHLGLPITIEVRDIQKDFYFKHI